MLFPKLTQRLDVMLSHDWPRGIAHHGDLRRLLRAKPFLQREVRTTTTTTTRKVQGELSQSLTLARFGTRAVQIESGVFGSPPAEELLNLLQPDVRTHAQLLTLFIKANRFPLPRPGVVGRVCRWSCVSLVVCRVSCQ